ncbi:MAG: hypothetical protein OHK0039_21040 [Bacteroidia bacterium]
MLTTEQLSQLCFLPDTPLLELLERQNEAIKSGLPSDIALVVDDSGCLIGTITQGDLRRAAIAHRSYDLLAGEVMQQQPISFPDHLSYKEIIRLLPEELDKRGRKSKRFLQMVILIDEAGRPSRLLEYPELWEQRVASHRHIVVVGMGYVGFTLAVALADKGFKVSGVDIDADKIALLKQGQSYIHERGLNEIFAEQLGQNFFPVTEIPEDGEVFIITVGTPVAYDSEAGTYLPDLGALRAASLAVGANLKPSNLVILRSTVPVGTTREFVQPLLEATAGLRAGQEFHLAFAPERTAEGKAIKELRELPQVIGGVNEESVEATAALFRDLTPTVVRVNSLEQAELVKLINNTYRDLIFAYANQVAQIASQFNLDVVETIRAANQGYPRDPVPLPSPGVGGPCLTKDPYIFDAVAQQVGAADTLFSLGRRINESMHDFVVSRVREQLVRLRVRPGEATVLVCGLAFKGNPETGDMRNSSAVEIAHMLRPHIGRLLGHDPVAAQEEIASFGFEPVGFEAGVKQADAVLFLNNHLFYERTNVFDLVRNMRGPALVFDGWKLFNPRDVIQAGPCVYMSLSHTLSSVPEASGQVVLKDISHQQS